MTEKKLLPGSEIVVECLKEQGVTTVFGYPGGAILEIYDALYKHRDEITHILTSHEQGASHAADGYARASGRVGVCMATSGPGATNLVTGIATAYMDSIPMVAITCNVGTALLGKDSFQEIDITGITLPITKYNFIVKKAQDLAPTLRRAFRIAKKGRPGPVLVDITKSATIEKCEYIFTPQEEEPGQGRVPDEEKISEALSLITGAQKPFMFVGGGAVLSGAAEEVRSLAHRVQCPVADSLMGKGAFDGEDELYTGMLGMHGTKASNFGVSECDLLIVAGSRFSDRVTGNVKTFARNAKILQIDIDAAEINKNVRVDCAVTGDLKVVLRTILSRLPQQSHSEWTAHVEEYREKYPLAYNTAALTGPFVAETLYELTHGDAVICTEVGQHQMWAAQYYKYRRPRSFITSGGLGTMGYGLGAAIGAKMACADMGKKDLPVINIAGDGCFRMNLNELMTLSRHGIPVIEIVINNRVLGMVRQWQTLFYGGRYSHTVLNDETDYVKLSQAMGVAAMRVTTKEEVRPALEEALAMKKPVVIDVHIDSDDFVFPMVSPGAPIDQAFDEKDMQGKEEP